VAQKAVELKMGALVLKNHVMETGARAFLTRRHVPGVPVFGGIVLNDPYGINAEAVQWMWRMEGGYGKVVWLPTFDADNHVKTFKDAPEGIKVVDSQGKVLPAVIEIMQICAKQNLALCTGHASATEALTLVKQAKDVGVKHVVVTHGLRPRGSPTLRSGWLPATTRRRCSGCNNRWGPRGLLRCAVCLPATCAGLLVNRTASAPQEDGVSSRVSGALMDVPMPDRATTRRRTGCASAARACTRLE
jgi:Family of unknown function (DUF6282)